MANIFILNEVYYIEDHYKCKSPVIGSFCLPDLMKHKEQLEAAEELRLTRIRFMDGFNKSYREKNPKAESKLQIIPKKKFPAGMKQQDITAEMRAERDAHKESVRLYSEDSTRLMNEWHLANQAAMKDFATAIGIPESEHDYYCKNYFSDDDKKTYVITKLPTL